MLAPQDLYPRAEAVLSISVHCRPDSRHCGFREFSGCRLLMVTLSSYALVSPLSKLLSIWWVALSHYGQSAIIDVWLLDTETDVLWSIYGVGGWAECGVCMWGGGYNSLRPCVGQVMTVLTSLVFTFTWHALVFFNKQEVQRWTITKRERQSQLLWSSVHFSTYSQKCECSACVCVCVFV